MSMPGSKMCDSIRRSWQETHKYENPISYIKKLWPTFKFFDGQTESKSDYCMAPA